jgi:hypothetical protein
MNEKRVARIVPPPSKDGITITRGTKVFVGGVELACVTKIVLTAEINEPWRADISCLVRPPDVTCIADVDYRRFASISLWQRFKFWWADHFPPTESTGPKGWPPEKIPGKVEPDKGWPRR